MPSPDLSLHTQPARAGTSPPRPPILFLHGMFVGGWVWENYLRFFAERGYAGYALSLPGHPGGRAVPELGRLSMQEYIDEALRAAREIPVPDGVPGGGLPIVFGHSMGGLIAQKLAEAGAAAAAVLVCPAPPRGINVAGAELIVRELKYVWPMLRSRAFAASRGDHDAITFNRVPREQRDAIFARFAPESGRAARELALGKVAVDDANVRCPLFVASAADDKTILPSVARLIARKYHAPIRVYDEHAHMLPAEPGWEGPAADIERWLTHTLHLLERSADHEALWASLRARIGDVVTLRFFDGHAVRAEIVNVDNAAHQDVIYEVREVLARGAAPSPAQGTVATASLYELSALE